MSRRDGGGYLTHRIPMRSAAREAELVAQAAKRRQTNTGWESWNEGKLRAEPSKKPRRRHAALSPYERVLSVLHMAELSATCRLVLAELASYDGPGGSWPSIATVSENLGLSRSAVERAIKKLVAAGRLRRVQRQRASMNQIAYIEPFSHVKSDVAAEASATSKVNPATSEVTGPATSEVTYKRCRENSEDLNARERAAASEGAAARAKGMPEDARRTLVSLGILKPQKARRLAMVRWTFTLPVPRVTVRRRRAA